MKAKKQFGQNFLIDENIILKIVKEINILPDSLVIEIGPGQGALTKYLVKEANKVLAYEIDKDCVEILNKKLNCDNLEIINQDILEANIKENLKKYNYKHLYVVGNLPYYITTAILLKLIASKLEATKYIFMVQNEVADRYTLLENNKEYNSLTVYLNYLFKTKKCFIVKNTAFNPIPKVTSAIISLENKEKEFVPLSEEYFYNLNKQIFRQKRKTLLNNLKDIYDLETINKVYKNLSLKPNIRAEELTINDIINLSDEFFKQTNVYEYANGKINLTLRVFKENKGYHKINSLMVPIELKDTLVFTKSQEDRVITNLEIKDNIILKTIKLFKEKYNIKEGVTVYLKKEIPLAAGLAGGSSNSSATFRGLNKLFNLNKSLEELSFLAKELGSDNNFCLFNLPAVCSNRGEELSFIAKFNFVDVILIKPNLGLSTKEIYDRYKYEDRIDYTFNLVDRLINNESFEEFIFNDLEKPALINSTYLEFYNKLKELNITSYQSGSGPTRYIFDMNKYELLKKEFKDCLIIKTRIIC